MIFDLIDREHHFKDQKFAGWEGRFTPDNVSNTLTQIVSPHGENCPGMRNTLRLERDTSAGVNRPSQPANFHMLSSVPDRLQFSQFS
jgi:hypothetical protein